MKSSSPIRARESGSAVLAALAILAVTLVIVSSALSEARNRFRSGHQSSRWTQASHAAEAGAELAMLSAQKATWVADGWSGAPAAPGGAAVTKTYTLSTGVSAVGPITATVAVDQVAMNSTNWLRIRSTGSADLSGGAVAGIDAQDVLLRKLSLRKDRTTGSSVTAPQAIRTLEILAQPKAARPFKYALVTKKDFDFHSQNTVDSYDSSNTAKSSFTTFTTYGTYDAAKRQQNGDVGDLAAAKWNLSDAQISGDVLTQAGSVDHATHVSGTVQSGFTFTVPDEVSPNWIVVTQNHGVVKNVSKTIDGGTKASPTLHKFTSIEMSADFQNIHVQNPAGQIESWVEIWVTGAVKITDKNQAGIKIDPGVHATIYFGDKVEINGDKASYGIANESKLPENLIMRAYGGSSGSDEDMIFKDLALWGVISAPRYKVKFDGDNDDQSADEGIHGAFLGDDFEIADKVDIHYDEALANLGLGAGTGYEVKSWVEAVR